MLKLSLACLVTSVNFKWEDIISQDWRNEQVIIGVTVPVIDFGGLQNWKNCTIIYSDEKNIENEMLAKAQGDYLIWINPQESIQKNFLSDVRKWIEETEKPTDKLLYGLGFVYRNGKTVFSPEALPILSSPISEVKILDNFGYLLPWVKYIYRLDLIKDWNLKYEAEADSWMVKQALFAIDYISSLYKVNGFVPIKSITTPFSFITGFDPAKPFLKTELILEKIQDKKEIWQASFFSPVSIKYRWLEFKKQYIKK
jgi:hypothetical protein